MKDAAGNVSTGLMEDSDRGTVRKGETMKIEKKTGNLGCSLDLFFRLDFQRSTEKNCSGIIRSSETKELKEGKSNQRILLCHEDLKNPDRFYLKPPTPLQKFGWMEKNIQYGCCL